MPDPLRHCQRILRRARRRCHWALFTGVPHDYTRAFRRKVNLTRRLCKLQGLPAPDRI